MENAPGVSQAGSEMLYERLKNELEQSLRATAHNAARLESERTREWLDKHGLPKASRVAQKEAFNILRSQGLIRSTGKESVRRTTAQHQSTETDRQTKMEPRPLSQRELAELAEMCVTMQELKGQSFEDTLSGLRVEVGGNVLAADIASVNVLAQTLAGGKTVMSQRQ